MQLLSQSKVLSILCIGRSTLFGWRRDPDRGFPAPICESPLLWLAADIDAFISRMRDEAKARRAVPALDEAMRDMAGQGRGAGLDAA